MRTMVWLLAFALVGCSDRGAATTKFHKTQEAVIAAHAKRLQEVGRMPRDFHFAERVLGQFGWHNSGSGADSVGSRAPLWLLQSSGSGSFGAYSFFQPAFDQAMRSWWIDGVMEHDSDLLWPMNANAEFTEDVVGHFVDFIYQGDDAVFRHVRVIGLPKYPDGSLKGVLQLEKKSAVFARQWGIGVLPPDYVDMCACVIGH